MVVLVVVHIVVLMVASAPLISLPAAMLAVNSANDDVCGAISTAVQMVVPIVPSVVSIVAVQCQWFLFQRVSN